MRRALAFYHPLHGLRAHDPLWLLLTSLLVLALLGPAYSQAQPPNVTGTWADSGGGIWELQASGPGLSSLHATWRGGPGSHAGIRGSFDGMRGQGSGVGLPGAYCQTCWAYTGTMSISEGSYSDTGTMTFVIFAADKIAMSYQQSNGPRGQNIILARQSVSRPPQPSPGPTPPPPSSGVNISNI